MKTSQKRKLIYLLIIVILVGSIYIYDNYYRKTPSINEGVLSVYFIGTGQSDCILIETPDNKFFMIDSGDNGQEKIVRSFLNEKKVKNLEYIIFTHPHADHIGGGFEIVSEYPTATVIMPNVAATTKTYKQLIDEVSKQNIPTTYAVAGLNFAIGDVKITVFSPKAAGYGSNLNEYSIVCRLDYGSTSFLFTGDAETKNEYEMIEAGYDLDVDVLKVGHHGSSTSSAILFLQAVSPEYAIIQCGKNNKYGHPHEETLSSLEEVSATVYRTDLNGTITVTSDGRNLSIIVEKEDENSEIFFSNSDVNLRIFYANTCQNKFNLGCFSF